MKVICIEANDALEKKYQLIVGKEYSVHHKRYDDSTVISDYYIKGDGFSAYYKRSMFLTLEEYREKKLNELGI